MPIKIALSGATGKMGRSIIKILSNSEDFHLVLSLNSQNSKLTIKKITKDSHHNNIDIWIDFSNKESCLQYVEVCKKLKIPMIIGTTGLNKIQHQKILTAARYIPILLSSNMSIGANISHYLLILLTKLWVKYYQASASNTKIIINEVHHKQKLDAPSGTALAMADLIKKNLLHPIPIDFISKRIGKVKGRHTAIFSNKEEEITIKHNVKNRSVFAKGTLMAAKWLFNNKKSKGIYSMFDIFNITMK